MNFRQSEIAFVTMGILCLNFLCICLFLDANCSFTVHTFIYQRKKLDPPFLFVSITPTLQLCFASVVTETVDVVDVVGGTFLCPAEGWDTSAADVL